jgi:hypothetical protein
MTHPHSPCSSHGRRQLRGPLRQPNILQVDGLNKFNIYPSCRGRGRGREGIYPIHNKFNAIAASDNVRLRACTSSSI